MNKHEENLKAAIAVLNDLEDGLFDLAYRISGVENEEDYSARVAMALNLVINEIERRI